MVSNTPFQAAPVKPTISYQDFAKVDIRVGTIAVVDNVPKSTKLVKLTVDYGARAG